MKKRAKQLLLLVFLSLLLSLPYFVFAAEDTSVLGKLQSAGGSAYNTNENDLSQSLGKIISAGLSLLGVIFVGLMIYAGFKWMMAAGDAEDVKKAKGTIRMAIIGLIVVASSYAIWKLIENYLL